jgi:hypothetical protein
MGIRVLSIRKAVHNSIFGRSRPGQLKLATLEVKDGTGCECTRRCDRTCDCEARSECLLAVRWLQVLRDGKPYAAQATLRCRDVENS